MQKKKKNEERDEEGDDVNYGHYTLYYVLGTCVLRTPELVVATY
jgi:hypothetical protein